MIRRLRLFGGLAAIGLAGVLGYAIRARAAGIPSTNALSYAGILEDANGPISGNHNIQVILYDAATAGNNLCQSTTAPINVIDGHFSVQLPASCVPQIGANANTWIDVLVDGSDTGRTMVGAVPYAVEANHAVSATSATNATTAATANAAGGSLATSISTIQGQVTALQAWNGLITVGAFIPDTSSGVSVGNQSGGWITGVTRNSAGNVTINIGATIFGTHTPNCSVTGSNAVIAGIESISPTAITVTLSAFGSGAATDSWMQVVCVGQPG